MANTTKTIVSTPNPLTVRPLPGKIVMGSNYLFPSIMYITMINLIENMTLQSKSKLAQACKTFIKTKKTDVPYH